MPTLPYIFRIAKVVKVTDGDTYHLTVDVGFHSTIAIKVRLSGYDCPEKTRGSDFEKAEAKRAQDRAAEFLARPGAQLWVRTEPDPDDFGRWLGDIWLETEDGERSHLGAYLRVADLASIWPTRWRDEFDRRG